MVLNTHRKIKFIVKPGCFFYATKNSMTDSNLHLWHRDPLRRKGTKIVDCLIHASMYTGWMNAEKKSKCVVCSASCHVHNAALNLHTIRYSVIRRRFVSVGRGSKSCCYVVAHVSGDAKLSDALIIRAQVGSVSAIPLIDARVVASILTCRVVEQYGRLRDEKIHPNRSSGQISTKNVQS